MRRPGLHLLSLLLLAFACARPAPVPETSAPEPAAAVEAEPAVAAPVAPAEPLPSEVSERPREPTAAPAPDATRDPEPRPEPAGPILLRVGLETDLTQVEIPCCLDGEMLLEGGDRRFRVRGPLTVAPDGRSTGTGFFRLQVAALKDEEQARDLARRLGRLTGQPAHAHFDAGVGLYRVRVGRYADRSQAETARRRGSSAKGRTWPGRRST